MAKNLFVPAIVILALVFAAVPVSAHHSWPVSYSQLVTVKGTVTEFTWSNPHPMITIEVRTNDGATEKWLIGGPAINRMEACRSKSALPPPHLRWQLAQLACK